MAATFRIRPWQQQLPSLRSTSCRPLGATPGRWAAAVTRSPGHDRMGSDNSMGKRQREVYKKMNKQGASPSLEARMQMLDNLKSSAKDRAMLAPMTIVPFPILKTLGKPRFFWYNWKRLKQHSIDVFQIVLQCLYSTPGWFKWPRITPERAQIKSAAKNLQHALWASMALGNDGRSTLAKICCPKMYDSLVKVIQTRPKGRNMEFLSPVEVKTPRIVDHKWVSMNDGNQTMNTRQAVVRLVTRQQLIYKNDKGEQVGEPKSQTITEHLVLWRTVDMTNFTQGDWLIYGTLKPTTPKDIERDLDMLEELAEKQAGGKETAKITAKGKAKAKAK